MQDPDDGSPWITPGEAAALLRLHLKTVQRWCREWWSKLTPPLARKVGPRRWIIDRPALLRLIQAGPLVPATPDMQAEEIRQ